MIKLSNVTKTFQLDQDTSITPVASVDLEIAQGEFVMIVGRSGSGKTTLLNLCAGLLKPTSGQVLIDGDDIQALDEKALSEMRSSKMGFVFQMASMLPSLSVIQNVAVPSLFKGAAAPADRLERAREVLTLVGLGDRTEALPRQLSGGEVRRVAIARALMNRPEILIADEPTSDLDVQTELKIIGALQNVHQTGVTVLMVTHSLELIPYATRALRMEAGRLLPLEDGLEAQALPATFAEPKTGAATGQKPSGPLAWLRKPVHAAFVALGVSLAVLLVLAGLLIGRAGNEPAAATAGTGAAGPGPVLGGGGMSGSNGTYDPSEYNLYGNTGLYASVTGGGWPYKIDPPLGDGFKDPVELKDTDSSDSVFAGELDAKMEQISFGNTRASVMTYNGEYPGPLIRLKPGEKLKLELVNSLPATGERNVLGYQKNRTDLELYGLDAAAALAATDSPAGIDPGASATYEYDLSKQQGGSLGFVYPGVHGLAAEQQWAGLFAPVLIEDGNAALAGYETHTMVIKDLAVSGNVAQSHLFMSDFMYGKEGSIVTINGQINPVLSAKRGQVQRWHIVNASNARFYRLYLENHVLYLIGTDGGLLDRPYTLSTLVLAPGERADILVKATTAQASSRLISLPYTRQTANGAATALTGLSMSDQNRSSQLPDYYGAGMYRQGTGVTGVYGGGPYDSGTDTAGTSGGMGSGGGTSGSSGSGDSLPRGLYGTGTFGGQNPAAYAYWPAVTGLLGMTTGEILEELAKGKSLADIGQPKGIGADQIAQTVTAQIESNLKDLVSSNDLLEVKAYQELALALPIVSVAMTTKGSALLNNGLNSVYNPFMYDPLGIYGGSTTSAGSSSGGGGGGMGGSGSGTSLGNYDMSAASQVTLLTMTADGSVVDDVLPDALTPASAEPTVDLSTLTKQTIVFNMDMGNGYLNGMDFDRGPFTITSAAGTYEIWEIVNPTVLDQPFHLQSGSFRVLSIMGGDVDYGRIYTDTPALKDTIIVPRMGTVSLLVSVSGPARTAWFGSRIPELEDIGMMGRWEVTGN